MTVPEIKKIATEMGMKTGKMKKAELVQAIQATEGNIPCFQTSDGSCDQMDCLWRKDCLK